MAKIDHESVRITTAVDYFQETVRLFTRDLLDREEFGMFMNASLIYRFTYGYFQNRLSEIHGCAADVILRNHKILSARLCYNTRLQPIDCRQMDEEVEGEWVYLPSEPDDDG